MTTVADAAPDTTSRPARNLNLQAFPATVTLPDGTTHRIAKLLIHHSRLRVWVHNRETRQIDQLIDATVTDLQISRRTREHTLTLEDESTVTYKKEGGCGCGHPLKKFRPPKD